MPNARDKSIDGTHLPIDTVENRFLIHRDYIAHCLRYSHAAKVAIMLRGDLWALDVGCGREMPVAKMLYTNKIGANKYTGVDYNWFSVPDMLKGNGVFKIRLIKNADAALLKPEHIGYEPNFVTMLEVFEHVEPEHGRRILDMIKRVMRPDGVFLFSTPCFNGNPAGNHVAEPEYEIMGATLEDAGFAIQEHWGTFASIKDYRTQLYREYGDDGLKMFEGLKSYYDVNFLATVFAPLFPKLARNCMWKLIHPEEYERIYRQPYVRQFPPRLECKPVYSPTGSSSLVDDILDQDMYDRLMARYAKAEPQVGVEVEGLTPAEVTEIFREQGDPDTQNDAGFWPNNTVDQEITVIGHERMTVHTVSVMEDGSLSIAYTVAPPPEPDEDEAPVEDAASTGQRPESEVQRIRHELYSQHQRSGYLPNSVKFDDGLWPDDFKFDGARLFGRTHEGGDLIEI